MCTSCWLIIRTPVFVIPIRLKEKKHLMWWLSFAAFENFFSPPQGWVSSDVSSLAPPPPPPLPKNNWQCTITLDYTIEDKSTSLEFPAPPPKKYSGFWSGIVHQHFQYWHEGQPEVCERKKKEMCGRCWQNQNNPVDGNICTVCTFLDQLVLSHPFHSITSHTRQHICTSSTKIPPPPSDTLNNKQQTYLNSTHHLMCMPETTMYWQGRPVCTGVA